MTLDDQLTKQKRTGATLPVNLPGM
jgi:hypothetical protein